MNRENAMRKVLACLRLAQSSNPHEAANALRQARALMSKYGLTEADAAAAKITSSAAATRGRGAMVAQSVVLLARVIADGYRCRVLISLEKVQTPEGKTCGGRTRVEFFGLRSDAQVSAYAFTVLRRQLESDKSLHLKGVIKRSRSKLKLADRKRIGELFSIGWVSAIKELFPREAVEPEHEKALQAAIDRDNIAVTPHELDVAKMKPKTGRGGARDLEARVAGYFAGKGAKLHQGLEGKDGTGNLFAPAALEHRP